MKKQQSLLNESASANPSANPWADKTSANAANTADNTSSANTADNTSSANSSTSTTPRKKRTKYFSQKDVKTLALSSLGGTLEYYDFIIFVFFAKYIGANFFPTGIGEFWQQMNAYGAFAAGYIARPLGGVVMAHFGDKFGRKSMFMLSIVLMVIPTAAIAILPGYESIGFFAPLLLLLARLVQGIAIGGELPGAWVFIREHSPEAKKGAYLGILTSAVASGILLGSIVALFMHKIYDEAAMLEWAWRLPFALGAVFGVISIYLRRYLSETPTFIQMKSEQSLAKFPLSEVFRENKFAMIISGLMGWVMTVCVVGTILLMPNFAAEITGFNKVTSQYIHMCALVMLSMGCATSGSLCDNFGTSNVCWFFAAFYTIFGMGYFLSLYHFHDFTLILAFYMPLAFFTGGITTLTPVVMCELFRPQILFSGISFSYNIAYAISGFVTPLIITSLHFLSKNNFGKGIWLEMINPYYFLTIPAFLIITALAVRKQM